MEQGLLFNIQPANVRHTDVKTPRGYRGFAAFHKYWGKKPVECLNYLIDNLTLEHEVVLDPFVGSGLVAREAIQRHRRFIGIDINPVAVELARLAVNPPPGDAFSEAMRRMERAVRPEIERSYELDNGRIATHFLWDGTELRSVWCIEGRTRKEYGPTAHDLELSSQFSGYTSKQIRSLRFFGNSRINASVDMTLRDLFSGRALRNIDIIMRFIRKEPDAVRSSLLLTLTAASGQMSKMVFAVSRRGKATGNVQEKISVGSWVIGYWRPKFHFEVNVWNCFRNRAGRLMKALNEANSAGSVAASNSSADVIEAKADVALIEDDARGVLQSLPSKAVSLILTDPPHSDRMPYLELSEPWNAILGKEPSFDREIVVSNAPERGKNKATYTREMGEFFLDAARVLCDGGTMAILFNAHDSESWEYLDALHRRSDVIQFRGCFPMAYSAGSVVQDNRDGALRQDYVLVYQKCAQPSGRNDRWEKLKEMDGWSSLLPGKDT